MRRADGVTRLSMTMPVMDIGIVRMRVGKRFVNVRMGVRLLAIPTLVAVLVMLVVRVRVQVNQRLVRVLVNVPFGDM